MSDKNIFFNQRCYAKTETTTWHVDMTRRDVSQISIAYTNCKLLGHKKHFSADANTIRLSLCFHKLINSITLNVNRCHQWTQNKIEVFLSKLLIQSGKNSIFFVLDKR